MEEKMRRQKEKNKKTPSIPDDESLANEIKAPPSPLPSITTSSDETQIDDDGQTHNVDSAIQYTDEDDEQNNRIINQDINYVASTTTALPVPQTDDEHDGTTEQTAPQRHHQPAQREINVQIESEKLEVIEIKSDGSTGHLNPLAYSA